MTSTDDNLTGAHWLSRFGTVPAARGEPHLIDKKSHPDPVCFRTGRAFGAYRPMMPSYRLSMAPLTSPLPARLTGSAPGR